MKNILFRINDYMIGKSNEDIEYYVNELHVNPYKKKGTLMISVGFSMKYYSDGVQKTTDLSLSFEVEADIKKHNRTEIDMRIFLGFVEAFKNVYFVGFSGGLYDYETLEIEEVKDIKSFMDEIK